MTADLDSDRPSFRKLNQPYDSPQFAALKSVKASVYCREIDFFDGDFEKKNIPVLDYCAHVLLLITSRWLREGWRERSRETAG